MIASWLKKSAIACLAGVAGLAMAPSAAHASTVVRQLGAGWVATWDSSQNVDLFVEPAGQSADALILNKVAFFTTSNVNSFGGLSPIAITFQRQSVNAPQFLVIDSEEVVNQTGITWDGFTFAIEPSSTRAAFDTGKTDVSPPGSGFSISPFTSAVYSDQNRVLTLTGGTIPSSPSLQNVWNPGAASGELVINTTANINQLNDFVLKEQPLASFPPGPPSVIPLPAAAWSGLSGLLGLAVISSRKHVRKLFA